jgi:MarR family transcriptional regulator, lower aerobic nicotinate degradation pathway regulator
MKYDIIKDSINLVEQFESQNSKSSRYTADIEGFKKWMVNSFKNELSEEPQWEGKMMGRSAESVLSTLVVHMNRYAKNYFRAALLDSDFSSQDDVIYLIVLKFSPPLSKMELIKKNVHDKPAGMQIINRLIARNWAEQNDSKTDKRSKLISITPKGIQALEAVMTKVRQATDIVSGKLTQAEKIQLISILNKLNDFHRDIYDKNYDPTGLLENTMRAMGNN